MEDKALGFDDFAQSSQIVMFTKVWHIAVFSCFVIFLKFLPSIHKQTFLWTIPVQNF